MAELFHRVSHIPELSTCLEIHRLYTNDKYLNYWMSETRGISWDHMQFLESLLPIIYLSIKKIVSHKLPRIVQRRKVLYIRIFLFVNVGAFHSYLWWKKIMNMSNATINCYHCRISILEISTMPVSSGFFMKLLPIHVICVNG